MHDEQPHVAPVTRFHVLLKDEVRAGARAVEQVGEIVKLLAIRAEAGSTYRAIDNAPTSTGLNPTSRISAAAFFFAALLSPQ
jgi:hypothetical protein